jgi:sodium/hydrogen exchanger-like protein 6/7
MKHYAYHNMSRRTQLTTKFIFQVMAQLSENFIFIYLGLSLFTEAGLEYKPLFILVTVVGICVARYCAVFPLSKAINYVIRYRARKLGREEADVLPKNHQMMLYWAGLRGAVGVALAAGLQGPNGYALRATVLVVVVLTVIIFGGTTARMLEILEIRTGVVEEIDSDDEFDIEVVPGSGGTFTKKGGAGFGHMPRASLAGGISLASVANGRPRAESRSNRAALYSTSNANSPPIRPGDGLGRRTSSRSAREQAAAEQGLLYPDQNGDVSDGDESGLDLPPSARKSPLRDNFPSATGEDTPYVDDRAMEAGQAESSHLTARGAFNQLMNATTEDAGTLFSRIDEGFIKPHLLLDPGGTRSPRPHGGA